MTSSCEAESPAWICESEAETIWMSRIAMNMPNTMKMKATSLRLSKCSTTAGATAIGRGEIAAAFATALKA